MATPRIFLSSTCYDLNEVRDSLYTFIDSIGYIPVFSDKNDVFYHPDLHSHESCIKEIENCQIFVLIIGGRFGGNYVYDTNRSIVNAEYLTAKKLNIPIFTFIKREVNEDHRVFIRNKREKPEIFDKIEYPAIERQDTVLKIFDFIDEVRRSDINNAYFTFEFSRDIRDILKKQFAGLFYDFLWNRLKFKENERTNELLANLSLLGQKTEEIIENIYKKIDEKSAITEINKLDKILNAGKFFNILFRIFKTTPSEDYKRIEELSIVEDGQEWQEYLISKGRFVLREYDTDGGKIIGLLRKDTLLYLPIESLGGEISEHHKKVCDELKLYFNDFKEISLEERIKIISNLG